MLFCCFCCFCRNVLFVFPDLRSNDEDMLELYGFLRNHLSAFYFNNMYEVEDQNWNFRYIGNLIATFIVNMLYEKEYNYRIMCIFEDANYLFVEQLWTYDISLTYKQIQKGKDTVDLQDFEGTGYTCDICRCEISRYDYMFHCKSDIDIHDYCISCVDAIILQYNQMKKFIDNCLNEQLNDDCIDQIVTFCVGKVNKFLH